MKLKLKRSLSATVILVEIVGISLPLISKSIYDYRQNSKNVTADFSIQMERRKQSLTQGLDLPLWNFSPEDALNVVNAAANASGVVKVQVWDSSDNLFAKSKDDFTELNSKSQITIDQADVFHANRKIGKVEISYDISVIDEKNLSFLRYLILTNTLTVLFIIAFTYLLMRISVVQKIYRLKEQFQKLANKELKNEFKWNEGDEINTLGQSLENARKTLDKLFSELENSNQKLNELNNSLESQVLERSQQLTESSRLVSLGEMAGGIAHEINNPLAIISGKSRKLRRLVTERSNSDSSEELKELDTIDTTIERMTKIIKGLRSFSRDGSEDNFVTVTVKSIIDETLELCKSKLSNHSIELRVKDFDQQLSIDCRQVQIGQVILNLLVNANDALEMLNEKWIEIEVLSDNNRVKIQITDSGRGIPEEIRKKLMQPFFTTKPVGKGTGLGLSISKGIIESHHGSLSIDSNCPNTRFVIDVPLSAGFNKEAA